MRSRRRHRWGELVAGALLLTGTASAQEAPNAQTAPEQVAGAVNLDWAAPAECPERPYVLREVARLVGPAPSGASRAPVKARAVISRSDDGRFRVVITTFDEEAGERTMFAPSCHALADAIALVIALRVDPTLLDRAPGPPPQPLVPAPVSPTEAPASSSASPPAPAAKAPTASADTPAPAAGSPAPGEVAPRHPSAKPSPEPAPTTTGDQLALGASVASSVGDLPSLSLGGEVVVGWLHARARVELRAATALVQRADVPGQTGVGGTVQMASGGVRGCYALFGAPDARNRRPIGLAACLEGELDWIWVAGYGPSPLDANAGWVALGGGLLAQWDLGGGVALRANVDALAPLARPSFVIDDASGATPLVHRPGVAVGRAGLGVEMHFF